MHTEVRSRPHAGPRRLAGSRHGRSGGQGERQVPRPHKAQPLRHQTLQAVPAQGRLSRGEAAARPPPGALAYAPCITLPQLKRQRNARRVIQEGGDSARARQGASHASVGRGAEGNRGCAQGRTQGRGQGAHGKERGQGHRQGNRASGSGGGLAHGAGQSAGSGRRDTEHSAGQGEGQGKDAGKSSSTRGRTQGHAQGTKASGSGAHGPGQGAGSGRAHNQGHGQGHGRDMGVSRTGTGAGDRGRRPATRARGQGGGSAPEPGSRGLEGAWWQGGEG